MRAVDLGTATAKLCELLSGGSCSLAPAEGVISSAPAGVISNTSSAKSITRVSTSWRESISAYAGAGERAGIWQARHLALKNAADKTVLEVCGGAAKGDSEMLKFKIWLSENYPGPLLGDFRPAAGKKVSEHVEKKLYTAEDILSEANLGGPTGGLSGAKATSALAGAALKNMSADQLRAGGEQYKQLREQREIADVLGMG